MVDQRRTVSIDLVSTDKVSGNLASLAEKFKNLDTNLQTFNKSISNLAGAVSAIRVPPGFDAFVSSIKALDGVKLPDLANFASGVSKLSSVGEIKNLSPIADELKKLSSIKIPGVLQLAVGLEKLSGSTINMNASASAIKGIIAPLERLGKINVPKIKTLAEGIETLSKTVISSATSSSIVQFVNALTTLNGIKVPDVKRLATGILEISNIKDLSQVTTNIQGLVSALGLFKNVKIPSVYQLALGFKSLEKIDVPKITENIKNLANAIAVLEKAGTLKHFATLASDLRTLQTQLQQASPQLQLIQNGLTRVGKTADTSGRQVKGFGERLVNYIQYRVIADTVMKIQDAFGGALKVITEYDQSLKDLQAITGATTAEVSIMGDKIIDVAKNTKFSANEVASGMVILGQAGLTASEAVNTIGSVADLATGTLSDMSTTVDLVSTALNVFDIAASKSTSVADVFANAINRSKLTMDKLKTAFNYVGPIAKDAGVSFEESAASMMVLANAGQRASTIGTGLRLLFSNLIDPPKKLAEAVNEAGLSLEDLDPRAKGLQQVLKNLDLVITDSGQAFDIFGKRGAAAALALKGGGGFDSMISTVSESGTAAKMAGIQVEGLSVIFKNLKDRIEVLGVSLGNSGVSDLLRSIGKAGQAAVEGLDTFVNSSIGGFLTKSTLFVISATSMVVVLGKLITGIRAVTMAYSVNAVASASMLSNGALISARGASIASVFIGMKQSILVATSAIWKFITAGTVLSGVITSLAFPIIVLVAELANAISSINDFAKSSEEAVKSAAKFEELQGGMNAYLEKTLDLKEGSRELKDANIALRKELLKVADGNSSVADSARAAANSIDPYTGSINRNGEALKRYNDELQRNKFEQIRKSFSDAVSDMDSQTSRVNRVFNSLKANGELIGSMFSGVITSALNAFSDEYADSMEKIRKRSIITNQEVEDSLNFSEAFKAGKASMEDFAKIFAELDSIGFKNLSPQGQDLYKTFEALNGRASAMITQFVDLNEISFSSTIEDFKLMLERMQIVGKEADTLVFKFGKMKEIMGESPTMSFVEEFIDGTGLVTESLSNNAEAAKKYTDEQIANFQRLEKEASTLAKEYENIEKQYLADKSNKGDETAASNRVKAYEAFNEKVRALNRAGLEDAEYTAARQTAIEEQSLKESIRKIDELATINKQSSTQVGILKAKAEMDSAKRIEKIQKDLASKNLQILLKEMEDKNRVYDISNAENQRLIAEQEALGTITHEKAEMDRLKSSLQRHKDELKLNQEYAKKLEEDPSATKTEKKSAKAKVDDSLIKVQEAESAIYIEGIKQKKKADSDYAKDKKALEEALKKTQERIQKAELEQLRLNSEKKLEILAREKIEIEKLPEGTDKSSKTLEINKKISQENIALKKAEYESIKNFALSTEAERIKAERNVQKAITSEMKSGLTDQRAVVTAQFNELGEGWRRSEEGVQAYVDNVNEAYRLGMMSAKEHSEALILASDNVLGGLRVGLDKALDQIKTDAEVMSEIGASIPDKMATGLQSVFQGAMESAAAAKEAVRDWALSTINWISQIIIKQMILNAISAIGGMAEGGSVGGSSTPTSGDGRVSHYAGGGRVSGFSPNSKADNIPAWLTAREFVQPVRSVDYYGTAFMEAVRTLKFPKDLTKHHISNTFARIPRSNRLAEGGMAKAGDTTVQTGDTNLKVVNVIDKGLVGDYIKSADGETSIINVIKRNGSMIKSIIG